MIGKSLSAIITIALILTMIAFSSYATSHTTVYRDDLGDVAESMSYSVHSTLNAVLTAIGSANTTLHIDRELTATGTTITVPSNVHLKFTNAGSLKIGAGQTVVINGPLDAPCSHIFTTCDTIIDNCDSEWNEQMITGVTSSTDTNDKQVGTASAKITVSDNASIGILVSKAITPLNVSKASTVYLWIKTVLRFVMANCNYF